MNKIINTITTHNAQADRLESQRYFYLNFGLSPRKMNELEELGVIKSMPRTNPKGTKYYPVRETWNSIMDYIHKPVVTPASTTSIANKKNQSEKFKLKRRTKHA